MIVLKDEKRQRRRSLDKNYRSFFQNPSRQLFALVALASFGSFVIIEEYGKLLARLVLYRRLGRREGSMDIHLEIDTITPFAEVCPEEYPPSHAKLHDRRDHEVHYYNKTYGILVEKLNYFMDEKYEFPDILKYKNYRYAVWSPELSVEAKEAEASAWNGTDKKTYVEGPGFVFPREYSEEKVITLEGNYAAFNSWFPGNFGHFAHDWLPSIALMRHILPDDTKFLLLDNKMSRKFIKFIDPDFYYERVLWVPVDQVYEIKGSLTVDIPLGVPDPLLGCCSGWDPMRQWIAEKQPKRVPADEKYVVFYSRKGNKDTKHGRVLELELEKQALVNIQLKLKQHRKSEKIVIFTGQDEVGNKTLSIEEQFEIFRGAHTFIGPHGSGLGGNYLWMDPFASKCEERSKLLEFMPGPETPGVHALYASYYGNIRKWPFDYHSLLYTDKSTYDVTKINLQYLDDALDAMWGTPETMNMPIPIPEEESASAVDEEIKTEIKLSPTEGERVADDEQEEREEPDEEEIEKEESNSEEQPAEEKEAKEKEDAATEEEAHVVDEEGGESEEQPFAEEFKGEEHASDEPEEKTDNEEATNERIDVIESATEPLLEVSATSRRLRRSI